MSLSPKELKDFAELARRSDLVTLHIAGKKAALDEPFVNAAAEGLDLLAGVIESAKDRKQHSSWRSFKDDPPSDDAKGMIIYARPKDDGRFYLGLAYISVSHRWHDSQPWSGFNRIDEVATHWMPMPEPPDV